MMRSLLIAAALVAATPVAAQQMQGHEQGSSGMSGMNHAGMNHAAMMKNTPTNPFAEASMRMHEKMMAAQGSDVSETYIRKLIEHHRGAVEMSRIAVAQASDREARQVAQKTAAMQEQEIAQLQGWLKRHGKRAQ